MLLKDIVEGGISIHNEGYYYIIFYHSFTHGTVHFLFLVNICRNLGPITHKLLEAGSYRRGNYLNGRFHAFNCTHGEIISERGKESLMTDVTFRIICIKFCCPNNTKVLFFY